MSVEMKNSENTCENEAKFSKKCEEYTGECKTTEGLILKGVQMKIDLEESKLPPFDDISLVISLFGLVVATTGTSFIYLGMMSVIPSVFLIISSIAILIYVCYLIRKRRNSLSEYSRKKKEYLYNIAAIEECINHPVSHIKQLGEPD